LHDAIQFEQAGIPAVLIMTEPFQGLAARFAQNLGAPGYPAVSVPHPVATKDDETLDLLADKIADEVVARLDGS
jgi:hypothetical protein